MSIEDLPLWPSRGNRRKLEESWLLQLELRGLSAFLPEEPSKAPPAVYKAAEQFDRGDFWDCHETLEEVWLQAPYPLRLFYHSMIKVAVGLYHVGVTTTTGLGSSYRTVSGSSGSFRPSSWAWPRAAC